MPWPPLLQRVSSYDEPDRVLPLISHRPSVPGFLIGPLPLTSLDIKKPVGAFTREQESAQKKRCISDLSQPRSGGSFNDALSKDPVHQWPMVNPGTVQAAVALILDSTNAWMTKADVRSAYKNIAVQKRQRIFQTYKIGRAFFQVGGGAILKDKIHF